MQGRIGLVAGGASGIGEAVMRRLIADGAAVMVLDRDRSAIEAIEDSIDSDRLHTMETDITCQQEVDGAIEACMAISGRVDFLANCAGITHPPLPLNELKPDDFEKTIAVNLNGAQRLMQAAANAMMRGGGGAIVNVASTAAQRPVPFAGGYTASKFGMVGLSGVAALELSAGGIRVNVVLPGVTDTPLFRTAGAQIDVLKEHIPMGRIAQASEIAAAVVWLLGDEASYVTGAALTVDGGLTLA